MSAPEFDPELVEQAHIAGGRAYAEGGGVDDVVNAVLSAVADPLRAEGADGVLRTLPQGWVVLWRCAEKAERDAATAYQRGMVAGARQVLAAVEDAQTTSLSHRVGVTCECVRCEERAALISAAREAGARIEGGA